MCSIFDISEYVNLRNGEIRIITSHSCRGFRVCNLGFLFFFFMVIPDFQGGIYKFRRKIVTSFGKIPSTKIFFYLMKLSIS